MKQARLEHEGAVSLPALLQQALAEPHTVFAHPSEVLRAEALSREQKRAILASWASDAFAVESAPALRLGLNGEKQVHLDDILSALQALDEPDAMVAGCEAGGRGLNESLRRPRARWLRARARLN